MCLFTQGGVCYIDEGENQNGTNHITGGMQMFFFITLIVCFIVFMLLTSLFNKKHKVLISLASAFVVSVLLQVLEQFYLSSILVAAFVIYFIIGNISTLKSNQLRRSWRYYSVRPS